MNDTVWCIQSDRCYADLDEFALVGPSVRPMTSQFRNLTIVRSKVR